MHGTSHHVVNICSGGCDICEPVPTIFPKYLWVFEHFWKYGCFFPFKLTRSYLGANASRIGVPSSYRTSYCFLNGSRFRSTCFLSTGWTFFSKIQRATKNFNLHCCNLDVKEKSNKLWNPKSWRKSLTKTSHRKCLWWLRYNRTDHKVHETAKN